MQENEKRDSAGEPVLVISEETARKLLNASSKKAQRYLAHPDRVEELLAKTEAKLKAVPKVGDKLAYVPLFISMVRSYIRKEYIALPIGSFLALLGALLYFLSPVDLISDFIPALGLLDDAAVVAAALALIGTDVEDYRKWRDENQKSQ